ncbi:MAG: tRNA-dihydrouridine synthase, partial [Oscillospiraceae bacterium]|nr:tRNA-dihydrouridine synthase [Oscillospiraceae bacterium]
ANGDIDSPEAALRCRKWTDADCLMVGRAAFGDPWLFSGIQAALSGQPLPQRPPLAERMELALEQMELAKEDKGEHIACLEARKQLAWYLRGVRFSNYYKQEISKIATMEDIYRIICGIQRDLE